jgi:hypothetical protein
MAPHRGRDRMDPITPVKACPGENRDRSFAGGMVRGASAHPASYCQLTPTRSGRYEYDVSSA